MKKKTGGIILLVAGLILLGFGINAMGSFASTVSEALTDIPTNRALWLLIGGVVLSISGAIFINEH